MRLFERLDEHRLFNIRVWDFSFRSLLTAYGRDFFTDVILRHPLVTLSGINRYRKITGQSENQDVAVPSKYPGGPQTIVGAGFCLKPLEPACISDRANHDCLYFEKNLQDKDQKIPACCQNCKIRDIGERTLRTGSNFYIMTSAIDILHDMLIPALEEKRFMQGLFTMCRYSYEPFKIALLISGIEGSLFPFESGDCRDYATWHEADIGNKEEQTMLSEENERSLQDCLAAAETGRKYRYEKNGNIFYAQ